MSSIAQNIIGLKKHIIEICQDCDRDPEGIKIIAVSKTRPVEMIREAIAAGINDIGENYVQEASQKCEQLNGQDVNMHFIGPVQTNKIKQLLPFCFLLHSLDRKSFAEALQKRLEFEDKTINALIQVNTSGEATKAGISPDNVIQFAEHVSGLSRIKIKGLMTIAENSENESAIRDNFKQLKSLFDEVKVLHLPNFDMVELSIGMSSDYKIAIEEGATMIRIGSNIFGKR